MSGPGTSTSTGPVGSSATITINSNNYFLDGGYKIWWCKYADFPADQQIKIAEGNNMEKQRLAANFTVPESTYGANYVRLVRDYRPDQYASFSFTVIPSIKLSNASGSPGSSVVIKGTGFKANDKGTITFDGKTIASGIAANENGSFTYEFTIPEAMAGNHSLKATAEATYGREALASLAIVPRIAMDPAKPDIGTEVVVTGVGFAASSKMTVKYDGIDVVNSPSSDTNGKFSASFKVPESANKEHTVVATDAAGNTATFALPLEGKPPTTPSTISPKAERFGWFGAQAVTFTWTEATDPSGVTYTLEIADNLNFFPLAPGMRRADLTQTSCVVNLEPGSYFWRVRATDGAGNKGEWALSPVAFHVGRMSIWYLVGGGVVFLLIFILLLRAFFRRLTDYYN